MDGGRGRFIVRGRCRGFLDGHVVSCRDLSDRRRLGGDMSGRGRFERRRFGGRFACRDLGCHLVLNRRRRRCGRRLHGLHQARRRQRWFWRGRRRLGLLAGSGLPDLGRRALGEDVAGRERDPALLGQPLTNCRATISSTVLDALLTSIP